MGQVREQGSSGKTFSSPGSTVVMATGQSEGSFSGQRGIWHIFEGDQRSLHTDRDIKAELRFWLEHWLDNLLRKKWREMSCEEKSVALSNVSLTPESHSVIF